MFDVFIVNFEQISHHNIVLIPKYALYFLSLLFGRLTFFFRLSNWLVSDIKTLFVSMEHLRVNQRYDLIFCLAL